MADLHGLYKIVFDHASFVAWVVDRDGVILLMEGKGLQELGTTSEQLVGQKLTDLYPEDAPARRYFLRALAGEAFVALEDVGGRVLEVRYAPVREEGGEVTAVAGITTDVSERVAAERELERRSVALKRQADLLDLATDAILARIGDGTITYWNRGAERLYGYAAAEALGRRVSELLRTRSDRPLAAVDADLRRAGTWEGELHQTTRDGRERVVWTRLARRDDDDGEVILETGTDVTDRKAELEARIRSEEIIRAQSLAIQELSTPLIPITDEILVMPLVGLMDSMRVKQVMETLLGGLAATRGKVVILDITGISVVDTQVADALLRAARAARLLGAEVILTGIRPEVAQTLVRLDTDLGAIVTRGTLQAGIRHALGGRALG